MNTHASAWIRSIPSASFIPLWGLYLVVLFAAALFLIWKKQDSAVRSLTQHMQKPVMTLQVYEQYLKGEVRICPEDGYIHEMDEADGDKEDEQAPILYLKTHTAKIREINEATPRDRKYERMLCAKNRKDFADDQRACKRKTRWFPIGVMVISTVLIYLPALMRMAMGLSRGKAVGQLNMALFVSAIVLLIGLIIVRSAGLKRAQTGYLSTCRAMAEQAFPRRSGMNDLAQKAEKDPAASPLSATLLRLVPFPLARMKDSPRILCHFHLR